MNEEVYLVKWLHGSLAKSLKGLRVSVQEMAHCFKGLHVITTSGIVYINTESNDSIS